MIMIAVLHEVLLMVILPMLLPLIRPIKDWFSRHPEFGGTFVRNTLQSKVLRSATTSTLLRYSECSKSSYKCYHFKHAPKFKLQIPDILLLTKIGRLPKKKGYKTTTLVPYAKESWFPILCHNSSDTNCYKNNTFGFPKGFPTFWAKKENYYSLLLFTCHYSLVLFTVTVHSEILPI